ncbi:MAG: helix-turn-helix transcriptional regulator [Pseudomonadota bacterium]|nr:helix-turn-helix transcriptional regulator [Pseudomonadota bacterium]
MDRRYRPATLVEQLQLRRQAIEDVLAHPEWSLAQSIRHLKTSMRLTTAELAKLAGVSFRTLQDIERGRSDGVCQGSCRTSEVDVYAARRFFSRLLRCT